MGSHILERPLPLFALSVVVVFFWGINFLFAKIAIQGLTPFLMSSVRFGIVGLIVLPFFRKPPLPFRHMLVISVVFGLIHITCLVMSLNVGLDTSIASVVQQSGVIFMIILSSIILKTRPSRFQIIGTTIAFIGLVIMFWTPNAFSHKLGFALMVFSAFFWALYSVQIKQFGNKFPIRSPIALIGWIAAISSPCNLVMSLIFESSQLSSIQNAPMQSWACILCMACLTSLGSHVGWAVIMSSKYHARFAPMPLLVPVVGVFVGVLFADEALSRSLILGTATIITGLGISFIKR